MRKILVFVEYVTAANFFARIALADCGSSYTFVSESLVINRRLKRLGLECISPSSKSEYDPTYDYERQKFHSDLRETKPYLIGGFTEDEVWKASCRWVSSAASSMELSDIDYVFVWNGHSVSGIATKLTVALFPEAKSAYFELANLPGKIFMDPAGVNAKSWLYRNPDYLLEEPMPTDAEWQVWRDTYLTVKKQSQYAPPQVSSSMSVADRVLEYVWARFFGGLYLTRKDEGVAVIRSLLSLGRKSAFDTEVFSFDAQKPFVFFPMQVDHDSQLLINSSLGNRAALEAILECDKRDVVVKPHPASEAESWLWLVDLAREERSRVHIATGNTLSLIESAAKVYAINSTVGMEALILEREVTFLGNSLFEQLSPERLRCFILRHLIDLDFFSSEPVSERVLERVFRQLSVPIEQKRYEEV
ncbi:MAG: hypothetical protein AAGI11_15785 [Pseudomonadota bacterium]